LHCGLEFVAPRRPHHLEGEQGVLETADRGLAARVFGVQPVDHRRQLRRLGAQFREQQLAFLAVVQPLGELVDVEQHRAQDVEIGHRRVPARVRQQHRQRAQHGRQRLVFVLDDLQCARLHRGAPGGGPFRGSHVPAAAACGRSRQRGAGP
jgi:hypothetical protein